MLNLLDEEWTLSKGQGIVERAEDLAPQPLVVTPLVMITWEERARTLAAAAKGDPTDWKMDWVTPEQQAAAKELRDYLLGEEAQARALEFGFRPANMDVKVVSTDPQNPWNRPKPYGVRLDVPRSNQRARSRACCWRPGAPASVRCCTSDLTLAEFKTLKGKMDAFNGAGRTPAEYMDGTPRFRTDLYSAPFDGQAHGATLLTHAESIELFKKLGRKMTPELKEALVTMPFNGFTQEDYAQKLIDEYKSAGVPPSRVFAQSFFLNDVLYWIQNEPSFGKQAVFLDDANVPADVPDFATLVSYRQQGVRIVAPPTWVLLALDGSGKIVPSEYAKNAKRAGLDIITWTLERSGLLKDIGGNPFYYQTILPASATTVTCTRSSTCSHGRSAPWACSPTGRPP